MPNISDTNRAYIAGIFDGEGCISLNKRFVRGLSVQETYNVNAMIVNNNLEVLEFIQEFYGGSIYTAKNGIHRWQSSCRIGLVFLTDILEFLIIKKDQVLLGVEFQQRTSLQGRSSVDDRGWQRYYYLKMKLLKRFPLCILEKMSEMELENVSKELENMKLNKDLTTT